MAWQQLVLLLCEFFLCSVRAIPYDLLNRRYMNFNWLEFSTTSAGVLNSLEDWTTVTTTTVLPVNSKVISFLSLPDLSSASLGPPFDDNFLLLPPIVPKMNGLPSRNTDGTYTFQFKLVHPNDSHCSKQWATPIPRMTRLVTLTWMVAVEGAYSILTNYTDPNFNTNFIIGSGPITRASSSPTATSSNGNAIQFPYPAGCDKAHPTDICVVNPISGSIQQLQTSVNKADSTLPLFLSVRAWQVKIRSAWFVLVPHDSYDSSYFVISTPETLGFIVFPSGQALTCTEGFGFETLTFTNVTSRAVSFEYVKTYLHPPGVFGMLGSVTSMVDSTSLTILNSDVHNAVFITKEDQCTTEQTAHITPETVHVLLVGKTDDNPWLQCYAMLLASPTATPTLAPTDKPSSMPTFDPTEQPSREPTIEPTTDPSVAPTLTPTESPFSTSCPTLTPTTAPTRTCTRIKIHIDQ
jgi:hypothetical protein